MKELVVRLDDDTFLELWAMARRYGTSLEDAARRCIKYVLKEVENPHGPDQRSSSKAGTEVSATSAGGR